MRILMVAESLFTDAPLPPALKTTAEDLRALGHEVTLLPLSRVSHSSASSVRRLLLGLRPDVVHAASPVVLGVRVLGVARELGIPTVAVRDEGARTRSSLTEKPWLRPAWDKLLASVHQEATLNLGTSRDALDRLLSLGSPNVFSWSPGTDTELFSPRRRTERIRSKLRAKLDRILVGFVGSLDSERQIEDLRVVQSLPGVRLVVIGEGQEHQRLAETLHRAIFLGRLEGVELAEHLASLDVLVHPGEALGSGRAVREAMACGVVPVAVGRGGALDLVEHGVTGLHYEPGRLDQLRSAVEDLQNPERRERLAAGAQAVMQTRSRQAAAFELEDLYLRACAIEPATAHREALFSAGRDARARDTDRERSRARRQGQGQRSVQGSTASTPQAR